MKVQVKTLFDCSATGVTGHYKPGEIPFRDHCDNLINNQAAWNHSRNQQRNWETLQQVVSLRCQIDEFMPPTVDSAVWQFEFSVDRSDVFGQDLCELRGDCRGVPMIIGLDERKTTASCLITDGDLQNIWFEHINKES